MSDVVDILLLCAVAVGLIFVVKLLSGEVVSGSRMEEMKQLKRENELGCTVVHANEMIVEKTMLSWRTCPEHGMSYPKGAECPKCLARDITGRITKAIDDGTRCEYCGRTNLDRDLTCRGCGASKKRRPTGIEVQLQEIEQDNRIGSVGTYVQSYRWR